MDEAARPLVCLFNCSRTRLHAALLCVPLVACCSDWSRDGAIIPRPGLLLPTHGRAAMTLDVFGCQWISLHVCGCLWMSLDVFACVRMSLVSFLVVCWSGCSITPCYDLVGRETQRTVADTPPLYMYKRWVIN